MVEAAKQPASSTKPSRSDNVHSHIFTPKPFLVELLETTLRENTIACLVNDTGKHFLFVSLLKRLSHQLRRKNVSCQNGKMAVFVASSDIQVETISRCITIHTIFSVASYCDLDDSFTLSDSPQVVVTTAPGALSLLTSKVIKPERVELVVFDECHYAVEREEYASIMKQLLISDSLSLQSSGLLLPRILAVTSSILDEQSWNPLQLESLVSTLELIFQGRAEVAPELVPMSGVTDLNQVSNAGHRTLCEKKSSEESENNVERTNNNMQTMAAVVSEGINQRPKELVIHCSQYYDETGLTEIIDFKLSYTIDFVNTYMLSSSINFDQHTTITKDGKDSLHSVKVALNECHHILFELGPWCASAVSRAFNKQLVKLEACEFNREVRLFLQLAATTLRSINVIVEDYFDKHVHTLEEFMALTSSKVVSLLAVLHQHKPNDSFTIVAGNYENDFTAPAGSDDEGTTNNQANNNITNDSNNTAASDEEEDGVVSHEAWSKGGRAQAAMGCVVSLKDGAPSQEEEDMQCVVFVDRKHVAYALNKLIVELCNWDVDLYFVRSHYLATTCTSNSKENAGGIGTSEVQRQEEVLRKFRTKELNLLVSTAVLEGGIDLPRCNLIIRFTPSVSYRSYIQSKARARSSMAKFVHLVDSTVRHKFESDLCAFKGIEKILFNRCRHQQQIFSFHSQTDPSDLDSLLPRYYGASCCADFAYASMTTAIKIINRYCAKLPSDTFTHLAPKCSIEIIEGLDEESTLYRATLKLPINSPVKNPVVGVPMPTVQTAKMAAAMEMCKVLYQSEELDDNLQPMSKDLQPIRKDDEDEDELEWEEPAAAGQGQVARPGSTKRKQYYKKRIASPLIGPIHLNAPINLYAFNMELTGPISEEQNTRGRPISAPENTSRGFGLLCSNVLQQVPHFPVFTRSGEVTVSVDFVTSSLYLDEGQLNRLYAFHKFLFSQVLKLEKSPMQFSPGTAESGCVIVPINKDESGGCQIDWSFIQKVETYPPPTSSSSKCKPVYGGNPKSPKTEKSNPNSREVTNNPTSPSNCQQVDKPLEAESEEQKQNGWEENLSSPGIGKSKKKWVTFDDSAVEDDAIAEEGRKTKTSPNTSTTSLENPPSAKTFQQDIAESKTLSLQNQTKHQSSVSEKFRFEESVFADAVVTPSYRNVDQPQYFYVAEIRRDLSLNSPFPSPELYETFRHYYAAKYGLVATDNEQPLLDVDHTSARLNLLTPRYVNQKGIALPTSSAENRRAKRESLQQKQILVPELCYVHPFPASLWQKAVCVPTILYRINYLLIADELRTRIATEACLFNNDNLMSFTCKKFPGLQFRFAVDGETTSTLAVSRRSGRRSCFADGSNSSSSSAASQNSCRSAKSCDGNDGGNYDSGNESISENGNLKQSDFQNGSAGVQRSNEDETNHVESTDGSCTGTSPLSSNDGDGMSRTWSSNSLTCDAATIINDTCVADGDTTIQNDVSCAGTYGIEHSVEGSNIVVASSLDSDSDHSGPGPCDIIQTLTMSNANDFFNLERLETIGDSFLKFAITVYLYCTFPGIHEGKLSYMRSIQVSNYNLYLLGRKKGLADCMVASKFEPMENWLPPCYIVRNSDYHNEALNWKDPEKEKSCEPQKNDCAKEPNADCVKRKVVAVRDCSSDEASKSDNHHCVYANKSSNSEDKTLAVPPSMSETHSDSQQQRFKFEEELRSLIIDEDQDGSPEKIGSASSQQALSRMNRILIPFNLQLQHSLPDKSVADCVEALIGCYLACADQNTALRLMAWLGLKVLPVARDDNCKHEKSEKHLQPPASPLIRHVVDPERELDVHLEGYEEFERLIQYKFRDRSYLLQAFTHASYHCNEVTDCYQRLEFLGDAILDYIITRHLFEDSIEHSPGILTDLRSALVNNNIFAFLAVKWNYHKFLKYIAPQLFGVIEKFVSWFNARGEEAIIDEALEGESWFEDCVSQEGEEDVEVPKILGDVFESVAGAIYLDSGLSLDAVWSVYRRLMDRHITAFLKKIPKSPVRELLEAEPETAKFEKPERTIDGRVRVMVNIVGKGSFRGIGRNYRIAKTAAAKRALKILKLL